MQDNATDRNMGTSDARRAGQADVETMPSPRPHTLSPRRLTLALGGSLVVIAAVLFSGLSYIRWQAALREVERRTNLADMLAEQIDGKLDYSGEGGTTMILTVNDRPTRATPGDQACVSGPQDTG